MQQGCHIVRHEGLSFSNLSTEGVNVNAPSASILNTWLRGSAANFLHQMLGDLDGHGFKSACVPITNLNQLDGIKLAFGGAYTAADTQVAVNLRCAAAKATCGFFLYLFLGEGESCIAERLALCLIVARQLSASVIKAVLRHKGVFLIQCAVYSAVAAVGECLSFVHDSVQGDGSLLTSGNSINHELLSGVCIAAHENVLLSGLIGEGVSLGKAALIKLHSGAGKERAPV